MPQMQFKISYKIRNGKSPKKSKIISKLQFCINSKYDNPEYLDYMKLKEKFAPNKRNEEKKSLRQSLKLEELIKKSRELDRDIEGLEEPEERPLTEIENLVKNWRENKRIIGVKDSEVESRVLVI